MKKNKYSQALAGVFISTALYFTVACGNSNNNSNPQPMVQPIPNTAFQQCANCQNVGGSVIFIGESIDSTGIVKLNWNVLGQATGSTPGTYYGMVMTNGQLSISQPMNVGYCMIPAGNFILNTIQAGQWAYGIVSGLTIQAVNGPTSLTFQFQGQVASSGALQSGQISSSTSTTGRLFGNLILTSANGQMCQQMITVQ